MMGTLNIDRIEENVRNIKKGPLAPETIDFFLWENTTTAVSPIKSLTGTSFSARISYALSLPSAWTVSTSFISLISRPCFNLDNVSGRSVVCA